MEKNIDLTIQKPVVGLNTDVSPLNQPKGTYRFALNAVNESSNGDKNTITTEEGTTTFDSLSINVNPAYYDENIKDFIIIGKIYIDDNEHAVFGITNHQTGNNSSFVGKMGVKTGIDIFLYDADNSIFKFDIKHQITGEYRLRNGCEKTIYWVDGINDVKTINYSENYNSDLYNEWEESYNTWLSNDRPGQPPTLVLNEIKYLNLKLIKSSTTFPTFDDVEVLDGGSLKSGTYNFAIKYVDENGNSTPWLTTSQLVPIFNHIGNGNYDGIQGSINKVEDTTDLLNNAFGENPSNKRIVLTLGNLNESYIYYRIAVIESTSNTGLPTRVLESSNILTRNTKFVHDGNESRYTEIAIETIIPNVPNIGVAKHIAQSEDRLILANIKSSQKNYCGLQAFASKISSQYTIKQVETYNSNELGDPKNPKSYFEKISYMGGEVYAFGIVYIFDDGVETPAYHIPGRPEKENERDYVANDDNSSFAGEGDIEKWRVHDTASLPNEYGKGDMAFWEMQIGDYTSRNECSSNSDYWGHDSRGSEYPLLGQKIRHHKFPARRKQELAHHISNDLQLVDTDKIVIIGKKLIGIEEISGTLKVAYNVTIDGGVPVDKSQTIDVKILEGIFGQDTDFYGEIIENGKISNIVIDEENSTIWSNIKHYIIDGVANVNPITVNPLCIMTFETVRDIDSTDFGHVNLFGIEFNNIELPTGIVGYKIVRAKRDAINRTILSKGFSGLTRMNDKYLGFVNINEPFKRDDQPLKQADVSWNPLNRFFLTPENQFSNADVQPSYIKIEKLYIKTNANQGITTPISQNVDDDSTGFVFDNDGSDWVGTGRISKYETSEHPQTDINRKINPIIYLPYVSRKEGYSIDDEGTKRILYNTSLDNKVGIGRIDAKISPDDGDDNSGFKHLYYISMNVEKDIHPILDNIEYFQTKNNIQTEQSDINFGGDTFISHYFLTNGNYQGNTKGTRILDYALKVVTIVVAAIVSVLVTIVSFGSATGIAVALMAITIGALIVGGAATIVLESYTTFMEDYENTSLDKLGWDQSLDHEKNDTDDTFYNSIEHAYGMFVESDINISLRQDAIFGFTGVLTTHTASALKSYTTEKFLMWDNGKNDYKYYIIAKPEIYMINKDYQRMNEQKVWFPLPTTYDCCSDCLETFPNRVYYSEKSFLEENFDSFSNFLPLNYTTIPGEHGEVTNIFTIKNAFFAHTKSNLWFVPENIQERVTGDIVSLIGTGGFFGSTPKKIIDSNIGAAGSDQKFATIKTADGVYFIDSNEGVVYLLQFSSQAGTKLNKISDLGMSKWFKNNSNFILSDQLFKKGGKLINISNPANPNGSGFHSGYDHYNNRFLLTKKELILSEKGEANLIVIDNSNIGTSNIILPTEHCNPATSLKKLFYNNDTGEFYYSWCIPCPEGDVCYQYLVKIINPSSSDFFKHIGWTLSFSNGWISFHSYIPTTYIFDNTRLYSTYNNELAIHNVKGSYLNYYGEQQPHILDIVGISNPLETKIHDNILLQTTATKNNIDQRYTTFNKMIAYNSRQCSGELILTAIDKNPTENYMMGSVENVAGELNIKKLEKDWRINGFRDMVIDYEKPFFINDFTFKNEGIFIDKYIDESVINKNKDWSTLERFKDKYLRIRFIFDNNTDTKLTTNYVIESEQNMNS